jgi:hypothetical protein
MANRKKQPVGPPRFAILFYRSNGQPAHASGLASHKDLEGTRTQAQEAMRLITDAAYAELYPYVDGLRQAESVETVHRASVGASMAHTQVLPGQQVQVVTPTQEHLGYLNQAGRILDVRDFSPRRFCQVSLASQETVWFEATELSVLTEGERP